MYTNMKEFIEDLKFHVVMAASVAFGSPSERKEIKSGVIDVSSNFFTDLKSEDDNKNEPGGMFQCQIAVFLSELEKKVIFSGNSLPLMLDEFFNHGEDKATLGNFAETIAWRLIKKSA